MPAADDQRPATNPFAVDTAYGMLSFVFFHMGQEGA